MILISKDKKYEKIYFKTFDSDVSIHLFECNLFIFFEIILSIWL